MLAERAHILATAVALVNFSSKSTPASSRPMHSIPASVKRTKIVPLEQQRRGRPTGNVASLSGSDRPDRRFISSLAPLLAFVSPPFLPLSLSGLVSRHVASLSLSLQGIGAQLKYRDLSQKLVSDHTARAALALLYSHSASTLSFLLADQLWLTVACFKTSNSISLEPSPLLS